MITAAIAGLALAGLAAQDQPAWVWTYYDGDGAVVLAREVPDTDRLSAVLECAPGSGVARLTVYGVEARPDSVNVRSGDVAADTERLEADGLAVSLRLDHPLFTAFAGGAAVTLNAGGETASVPSPESAALARFRSACGGAA